MLTVSSYDTDAVAVREEELDTAIRLLETAGHSVKFEPAKMPSEEAEHSGATPQGQGSAATGKREEGTEAVKQKRTSNGAAATVEVSGD